MESAAACEVTLERRIASDEGARRLVLKRGRTMRKIVAMAALALSMASARSYGQFPPAPGTGPGLAETIEAIDSARVTTRILYVTAHPDDESAAVLTYLARGLHADVALLSLTRGEGGQNDLGPEQAPQLGLIRTEELLAATRSYGVRLYFTRAKDFGYSKTPEETQRIWGDQVLEDMVRVIREFRPNVVINGWGGVHTGHGHHQASGLLTPRAVELAADPSFKLHGSFPEEQDLTPWGDRKPVILLDLDRSEAPKGYLLPLDEISPLYGKSWREMGLDAFANHRTQGITGFLSSPFLRRAIALRREDGGEFDPASLAQPLGPLDEDYEVGNMGVDPLMRTVEVALVAARDRALRLDWKAGASSLAAAGRKINEVPVPSISHQVPAPVVSLSRSLKRKREKIDEALVLVAGLRLDALADRSELVSGETFTVRVDSRHRGEIAGDFKKPVLMLPSDWAVTKEEAETSGSVRFTVSAGQNPQRAPASVTAILPEPPPLVVVSQEAVVDGYSFTVSSPVTQLRASSARADRMPLRIVPAYAPAVEPKQVIEIAARPGKPVDVLLRVHSYTTEASEVRAGLTVPRGWKTGPAVPLKFEGVGDRYARLTVTPPLKMGKGNFKISAYAERVADRARGDKAVKFTTSLEPLPTLPTQLWSEPAQCVLHAFEVLVPANLRVGYVTAEGET